jgi:hypothetical protein
LPITSQQRQLLEAGTRILADDRKRQSAKKRQAKLERRQARRRKSYLRKQAKRARLGPIVGALGRC